MSSVPQESSGYRKDSVGPLWAVGLATKYGRVLDGARLKQAARREENWRQLTLFCLVGGSGYAVNLAVFAGCVDDLRLDPHIAAVMAFLCAVCNNLVWNRRWTFPQHGPNVLPEAGRFFVVSIGAFLVSISTLTALVAVATVPAIVAQVISIAVATPLSFAGNKLWTFRQSGGVTPTDSVNKQAATVGPVG